MQFINSKTAKQITQETQKILENKQLDNVLIEINELITRAANKGFNNTCYKLDNPDNPNLKKIVITFLKSQGYKLAKQNPEDLETIGILW